jgi:peptidoglycan hydrolase-like protein with peptidoglycan-binding domain
MSPGPLVAPSAPVGAGVPALSSAEIIEIQQLLHRLDLAPGNIDGVVTAETTAAIRSYQEMAGLSGDGEANRALLEELRSVVELYGG